MPEPNEEPSADARARFEAAIARVEARQAALIAAQERRIAAAEGLMAARIEARERRLAGQIAAHKRMIGGIEQRMTAEMGARERPLADLEQRMAAAAEREARGRRWGRKGGPEGREPVPAAPKPRPNPLSGGAAAPIDEDCGPTVS